MISSSASESELLGLWPSPFPVRGPVVVLLDGAEGLLSVLGRDDDEGCP